MAENGVLGAKNRVFGAGPLKRKVPGTAPILGERAKKIPTDKSRDFAYGGEEEDRTPDLRIANATLSQLSYPPTVFNSTQNGPVCATGYVIEQKLYKLRARRFSQ